MNVGNAEPPASLFPWVPRGGFKPGSTSDRYDVIVVGLQECSYTAADDQEGHASWLPWSGDEHHSIRAVATELGPGWIKVESEELWEMRVVVFLLSKHKGALTNVESATSATGQAHILGNKGGLAVKMELYSTSLCFVSCHLAAHEAEKYLLRRNAGTAEIMEEARMGDKRVDLSSQFHHVFWFGDLNYRVDMKQIDHQQRSHEERFAEVHGLVEQQNYGTLYQADQLQEQIRQRTALIGFKEVQPNFPPTFKVERNQPLTYKNQRIPSYCDRVLWKSLPARSNDLQCIAFDAVPEIMTSDHKPVFADFELKVLHPPRCGSEALVELQFKELSASGLKAMDFR
jgi:endonuclease/exonuclease/phosphatase family metal-dependent hydrolase